MTEEELDLDACMAARGYSYINGEYDEDGIEYVKRYKHKNGISELTFTEKGGTWVIKQ